MRTARTPLLLTCAVVLAAGSAVAQSTPQSQAEQVVTVTPLTITPPAGAPVPDVGPGAPLLSPVEIRDIGAAAERCIGLRDSAYTEIAANQLAVQLDSLAKAVEVHDGRIVLNPFGGVEHSELAAATLVSRYAREAEATTRAAEQARLQNASVQTLRSFELARQQSVNRLVLSRSVLTEIRAQQADRQADRRAGRPVVVDLNRRSAATLYGPEASYADLALEKVAAAQQLDNRGGLVLQISGQIRNTRKNAIGVPPLRLTAFDSQGFALKTVTADPGSRVKIAAGKSEGFTYELRPAPRNAAKVAVTFGANASVVGWRPSAPIGCDE